MQALNEHFIVLRTYSYNHILYINTVYFNNPNHMIDEILNSQTVWRGRDHTEGFKNECQKGLDTGFHALNQVLQFSGWPHDGITEIIAPHEGVGELSILLPALSCISQNQYIVWINPIFKLYGPALQEQGMYLPHQVCLTPKANDLLWSTEQSLRSSSCGAIILWPQRLPNASQYRRLQMLCVEYQTPLFMMLKQAPKQSVCRLRIQVIRKNLGQLNLTLLKCQHTRATPDVQVALKHINHWRYPLTLEPKPTNYKHARVQ